MWWKCKAGIHPSYYSSVNQKVNKNTSCPYCINRKLCKENSLFALHPKLSKQWNYTKNNNLTPLDVVAGSHLKVWWKCLKNPEHEWEASIVSRITSNCDCPTCAEENKIKRLKALVGEKNPNWNSNLTYEDREKQKKKRINSDPKLDNWRKNVFKRDDYKCQYCGDGRGNNLNAHHLFGWSYYKDLRYDVNNGMTLCQKCHKTFHKTYGYKYNTKTQFIDFMNR